eukprot:637744-Alexandrium_andersonii.AAC.1
MQRDMLAARNGAVVSLGQNPHFHAMHNIGKRVLSTVIKNAGMQYSTYHNRWLTPRELLTTQMFPAFARFSFHGATCSFTYRREDFDLPARHRG